MKIRSAVAATRSNDSVAIEPEAEGFEAVCFEVMGTASDVAARVRRELPLYFDDPHQTHAQNIAHMVEHFASSHHVGSVALAVTEAGMGNNEPAAPDAPHERTTLTSEDGIALLDVNIYALQGIDNKNQLDHILRRLNTIIGQLTNIDRTGVLQLLGDQRAKLAGLVANVQNHKAALAKLLEEVKKNPESIQPQQIAKALNGLQAGLKEIHKIPGLPPSQRHEISLMMRQIQNMPHVFPVLATVIPHLDAKLFPQPVQAKPTPMAAAKLNPNIVSKEALRQAAPKPNLPLNTQKPQEKITVHNAPLKSGLTQNSATQTKPQAPTRFTVLRNPATTEKLAERIERQAITPSTTSIRTAAQTTKTDTSVKLENAPSGLRIIASNPNIIRTTNHEARPAVSIVRSHIGERILEKTMPPIAETKSALQVTPNKAEPVKTIPTEQASKNTLSVTETTRAKEQSAHPVTVKTDSAVLTDAPLVATQAHIAHVSNEQTAKAAPVAQPHTIAKQPAAQEQIILKNNTDVAPPSKQQMGATLSDTAHIKENTAPVTIENRTKEAPPSDKTPIDRQLTQTSFNSEKAQPLLKADEAEKKPEIAKQFKQATDVTCAKTGGADCNCTVAQNAKAASNAKVEVASADKFDLGDLADAFGTAPVNADASTPTAQNKEAPAVAKQFKETLAVVCPKGGADCDCSVAQNGSAAAQAKVVVAKADAFDLGDLAASLDTSTTATRNNPPPPPQTNPRLAA